MDRRGSGRGFCRSLFDRPSACGSNRSDFVSRELLLEQGDRRSSHWHGFAVHRCRDSCTSRNCMSTRQFAAAKGQCAEKTRRQYDDKRDAQTPANKLAIHRDCIRERRTASPALNQHLIQRGSAPRTTCRHRLSPCAKHRAKNQTGQQSFCSIWCRSPGRSRFAVRRH